MEKSPGRFGSAYVAYIEYEGKIEVELVGGLPEGKYEVHLKSVGSSPECLNSVIELVLE